MYERMSGEGERGSEAHRKIPARTSHRKWVGCSAQVGAMLVQCSRNKMQPVAIFGHPECLLCNLRQLSRAPVRSDLSRAGVFVVHTLPLGVRWGAYWRDRGLRLP